MQKTDDPGHIEAQEREARELRGAAANPLNLSAIRNQERLFEKEARKIEERVVERTAHPFESTEIDKAQSRYKLLITAINNGYTGKVPRRPTVYEMETKPDGAVAQHLAHESFFQRHNIDANGDSIPAPNGYSAFDEARDLKRRINATEGNTMPGNASIEPERVLGNRPNLADMRLPVSFALSSSAKANYDATFPDHVPTDVERKLAQFEAQQRRIEELERQLNGVPRETSGPVTCQGVNRSGKPCRGKPQPGSQFCVAHNRVLVHGK